MYKYGVETMKKKTMKKSTKLMISIMYFIMLLIMIIMHQRDMEMLTFDIFGYVYTFSALLSFAFLQVFRQLPTKEQNILLVMMPLLYLLCFDVLVIVLIGFMGLTAVSRYERTIFVKVTRVIYLLLIAYAMLNVWVLPATFYGFQEEQFRVYRQYDSQEGTYIAEVLDYKTASNGPDSTYTIRFYDKETPVTKRYIFEVERSKIRTLEIEWLNDSQLKANDIIYTVTDDGVTYDEN